MLDFTYRLIKGSPLTWSELDGNFRQIADQAILIEDKDSSNGIPGLTNYRLNLKNDSGAVASLLSNNATSPRSWNLPDKSGTIAIIDDFSEPDGSSHIGYLPSGTVSVSTTVEKKLRESKSVKDSGAKGDGETLDTDAFITAQSDSKSIFVPDGIYLVDGSQINISQFTGGPGAILKFTNGGTISLGNTATVDELEQLYWQELSPSPGSTLSRNAAPQSLGACGNSIFMSQNVSSPDGIWAPTSVARFAEFPQGRVSSDNWDVTTNAGATAPTGVVDLVGTGHGSGASVIEEGGFRWLYSTVSSVGAPIDGPNCNYGTGFTKTKWQGSGTLQADMREFRGLQGVFGADMCVSVDGKYLVFAGYKFLPVIRETTNYYQTIPWVSVFDRAAVEAAADPSTVAPLHSFKVPSLTNGNLGYGVGAGHKGQ